MKTIKRCLTISFIAVTLTVPVIGLFANAPMEEPATSELIAYAPTKTLKPNKVKIKLGGDLNEKSGYTWGG